MEATTTLPPEIEVTFNPSKLRDETWTDMLQVRGIATMHHLWISEDGDTAIYFVAPESGSYSGMTRWANSEHDAEKAWNLSSGIDWNLRAARQQACERYVLEQAHKEVNDESSATTPAVLIDPEALEAQRRQMKDIPTPVTDAIVRELGL